MSGHGVQIPGLDAPIVLSLYLQHSAPKVFVLVTFAHFSLSGHER